MTVNMKRLRLRHQRLVKAEIQSTRDAGADHRLRLVQFYKTLGLHRTVKAELMRIVRQFPTHDAGNAAILDFLAATKEVALLRTQLASASKLPNPSTKLRLAIAKAVTSLRMPDVAAKQYSVLLRNAMLPAAVLPNLAKFVRSLRPNPTLTEAIRVLADAKNDDQLPPLLSYIVCRVLEDEDPGQARSYLEKIQVTKIKKPDIAFDLARLNFRFGNWAKAAKAAAAVLRISPNNEVAKRLLVSACTFGSRLGQARSWLRRLMRARAPLRCSHKDLDNILDSVQKQGPHAAAESGKDSAARGLEGHHPSLSSSGADVPDLAVLELEKARQRVTVSMPQNESGAWDILFGLDWTSPHVMVQQIRGGCILHVFVGSDGPSAWQWQEIPLLLTDGVKGPATSTVRLLQADANQSKPPLVMSENELLWRVRKELELGNLE